MDTLSGGIDYAAVLADLEAKRAGLDAAIAGVKQMLGQASASTNTPQHAPVGSHHAAMLRGDEFFQMSIPDAAIKYLKMSRKPQTTKEIAIAIQKGGIPPGTGDFFQTVGSVINRRSKAADQQIVSVKRGVWGLAEWYPGRKFKKNGDASDDKDETTSTASAESGK